jgi:hypothetical protein
VTWGVFLITTVLPIAAFMLRHPGALSSRFATTTYISSDMAVGTMVRLFLENYVRVFDLWHWTIGGDSNPRHHVQGVGTLLLSVVVLAATGAVFVIAKRRHDRFWWFFLAALLLVPLPAALVWGNYHALRSAALPVCLCVLAVPAIDWLLRAETSSRALWGFGGALVVLTVAQAALFQTTYWRDGKNRGDDFEQGVESAVQTAFLSSPSGRVYALADEPRGRTQLQWWSRVLGEAANVSVVPTGGTPPPGSIVFIRGPVPCAGCTTIIQRAGYSVYRMS